jgi:hypothetical protein
METNTPRPTPAEISALIKGGEYLPASRAALRARVYGLPALLRLCLPVVNNDRPNADGDLLLAHDEAYRIQWEAEREMADKSRHYAALGLSECFGGPFVQGASDPHDQRAMAIRLANRWADTHAGQE